MEKLKLSASLAEIKISYTAKYDKKAKRKLTCSKDAVDLFREIWLPETIELRESMYVLLVNRSNYVLGWFILSLGGVSGTVSDPKLIFSTALKCVASSLIIAHNHPSGNTKPSASDIQLTKNLVEGGRLLEISVLDHIILTAESFYSFADEGLI